MLLKQWPHDVYYRRLLQLRIDEFAGLWETHRSNLDWIAENRLRDTSSHKREVKFRTQSSGMPAPILGESGGF